MSCGLGGSHGSCGRSCGCVSSAWNVHCAMLSESSVSGIQDSRGCQWLLAVSSVSFQRRVICVVSQASRRRRLSAWSPSEYAWRLAFVMYALFYYEFNA